MMIDWKASFAGAVMILVLSVLLGLIHAAIESDTSDVVMVTMILGIAASLLGGMITGYLSRGLLASDAVNGFVAGGIAAVIYFIISMALMWDTYAMLSDYFGYGMADVLIASIPEIIINIMVMGIIASVGAIIGAILFSQEPEEGE